MADSTGARVAGFIKEINAVLNKNLRDKMKDSQLTLAQWHVLKLLAEAQTLKLSDISDKLNAANSTVSGIVDRMEKCGYVHKKRCKDDKRVYFIEPTEKARMLQKEFKEEFDRYLDSMLHEATSEEIEDILRGLETLQRVLKS